MVTGHFGVCRHHQLNVAGVGEEALASPRGGRAVAPGAVSINVMLVDCGCKRIQLLSHIPSPLKRGRPLGVFCFNEKRERKKNLNIFGNQDDQENQLLYNMTDRNGFKVKHIFQNLLVWHLNI